MSTRSAEHPYQFPQPDSFFQHFQKVVDAMKLNATTAVVMLFFVIGYSNNSLEQSPDLNTIRPIDFIAYLRRTSMDFVVIPEPVAKWVREDDVPELLRLLESNESCASVCLVRSSYIGPRSRVGVEALFVLNGYLAGSYPPALNSTRNHLLDAEEVKKAIAAMKMNQ